MNTGVNLNKGRHIHVQSPALLGKRELKTEGAFEIKLVFKPES